MGAAMAPSAAATLSQFFRDTYTLPSDYDLIVTGDLGKYGSQVLEELVSEKYPTAARRHADCGKMLYDGRGQDVHAGASGCGTSAALLALEFLPALERGDVKNLLFLSTGALMNPSSLLQGEVIYGVAPLIRLESTAKG
jgi:stage V sporulation protein AD